jgi:hypothetical protein
VDLNEISLPYIVPYYSQVATPELAFQIFSHELSPWSDPNWGETGAETQEEYAYWVERSCGIACVKMCVEALGGPRLSMMDWIRRALAIGGYLEKVENGTRVELGWIHQALADLIEGEDISAYPAAATLDEISAHLQQQRLLIASVSYQLGTYEAITRKGGHLVVVKGAWCSLDTPAVPHGLVIHNPSGRYLELQMDACIPADRFRAAYSGRVVVAGRNASSSG